MWIVWAFSLENWRHPFWHSGCTGAGFCVQSGERWRVRPARVQRGMGEEMDHQIVRDLKAAGIDYITSVPCKQLAGVIEVLD